MNNDVYYIIINLKYYTWGLDTYKYILNFTVHNKLFKFFD